MNEIEAKYEHVDKWEIDKNLVWDWYEWSYRVKQQPKQKLWYWGYKDGGRWYIGNTRYTEEQASIEYIGLKYKKLEALGFIEE